MTIPGAFNFQQWIEDNKDDLKPPVNMSRKDDDLSGPVRGVA